MRGLKAVLATIGVLCLLGSAPGALAPWPSMARWLEALHYETVPAPPLFVYLVRLSSVAFALIGVFFLILATNPVRYRPMLVLAVFGLIVTGALALVTGIVTQMQPPWYWADVMACLVAAAAIAAFWPRESRYAGA